MTIKTTAVLPALLTGVCALVGTAFAQQGPGAKPGAIPAAPDFVLSICNKSQEPFALVAIGVSIPQKGPGERPTHIQGWWKVAQGACARVGTVPGPGFIFHARTDGKVTWGGQKTVQLCVNLKDAFTGRLESFSKLPKQCPDGQVLAPFTFVQVPAGAKTHNLTLNPVR